MTTIEERGESLESEFRNRILSAVSLLLLLVGGYLVGVSVAVVVYFIINPWHAESYDPKNIWFILDILMVTAALPALAFNTLRILKGKASVAFYATLGVSILLFHNWFSVLALGLDAGDHQAYIKWAVVEILLPLVVGATGIAMWIEAGNLEDSKTMP